MTKTTAHKTPDGSTQEPNYTIESVDSALRLLRVFCKTNEIRTSEAAELLDVAPSTAHRLLSMLVYHGFAVQEGRGQPYRPGPTLHEMGLSANRNVDLKQKARFALENLFRKLNETVHIAIPYGQNVLYLDAIESSHLLKIGSRTGKFVPAHSIAIGKAMLATLPTETLHQLYPDSELPGLTNKTIKTRAQLEKQLKSIREAGYARSISESEEGVGSIAVAVLDSHNVAQAAISVGAPLARMNSEIEAIWVAAAQEVAKTLSAQLWNTAVAAERNGKAPRSRSS